MRKNKFFKIVIIFSMIMMLNLGVTVTYSEDPPLQGGPESMMICR